MKAYISPQRGPSGLGSVIKAQIKYLPQYGWQITNDVRDADLVCIHAGEIVETSSPIVQVCHGYFWSDYDWPNGLVECNEAVIEVSRRAAHIIVPSEWVATPIRRDLRKNVTVIKHGIEIDKFSVTPADQVGEYVLWGKPRVDAVCDPTPVNVLAKLAPDTQFITTFGNAAENVKVTGYLEYAQFQDVLRRAMIWLATTRESGDIASREAMAYGVPVLGWRWGATAELVSHGIDGYLAEPGDYDDLVTGLRFCIENRAKLSANARKTVERCDWKDAIAEYANVFNRVYREEQYPVQVSVVIPAYNYAHYLPECLNSVLAQRDDVDCEIIVVNDGSTDETPEVLKRYGDAITVIEQKNSGLAAALNTGHAHARGKYIINLDADNILCPRALKSLYTAMEQRPHVDIGTGMYYVLGEQKKIGTRNIDVYAQLNHINQIPSTCIMRARAIRGLGGYRVRQRKNEDAEFWCRAMSAGLRCEHVSDDPVFWYRRHGKNKSILEGGEDPAGDPRSWNFYYPWRDRDVQPPFAMRTRTHRTVPSYHNPVIAVVIPCGPGHEKCIVDALDSVYGQTFRNIECIVANDTGKILDVGAMGHPWVRVVNLRGGEGPAAARNAAIALAKAPLIVPLDADDLLYPQTLELFYNAWLEHKDCIVYADCDIEDTPCGKLLRYHSGQLSLERIKREAVYQDTILFARKWWKTVGGYDNMPFEDWLFGVKLHLTGIGGVYLQTAWGIYRHWTTLAGGASRSQIDNVGRSGTGRSGEAFKEKVAKIYNWIRELEMSCRTCGGQIKTKTYQTPESLLSREVRELSKNGGPVRVICVAHNTGARSLNSRVRQGYKYRYRSGDILTVLPGDEWITAHADFKLYREQPAGDPGGLLDADDVPDIGIPETEVEMTKRKTAHEDGARRRKK